MQIGATSNKINSRLTNKQKQKLYGNSCKSVHLTVLYQTHVGMLQLTVTTLDHYG